MAAWWTCVILCKVVDVDDRQPVGWWYNKSACQHMRVGSFMRIHSSPTMAWPTRES